MKKYFDKVNLIFAVICGVLLLTMIVLLICPIHYDRMPCYNIDGAYFTKLVIPSNGDVMLSPFKVYGMYLNIAQTAVFCSIALVFLVFAVLLTVRLAKKGLFADLKARRQTKAQISTQEQIADLQRQIDELKNNKKD